MKFAVVIATAVAGFLAFASPALATTIGPDSFGYTADDTASPFSYVDISGTGTSVPLGDDASAARAVGFTFDFYGTSYTTVSIGSNGLLTFGGGSSDFSNEDLTGAISFNLPTIAVFWDDLDPTNPASDTVYFETQGVAGSRTFITQWDVTSFGGTDVGSLQVILFEGSNNILFQYADVSFGDVGQEGGISATIGIRDIDGHTNGENLQWSLNGAPTGVVAGDAILFSVTTPEPGTLALMGLGLFGLTGLVVRRRKRRLIQAA